MSLFKYEVTKDQGQCIGPGPVIGNTSCQGGL